MIWPFRPGILGSPVPVIWPTMFAAGRDSHCISHFRVAIGVVGRASSAVSEAASRFEVQKRGTATGMERDLDSASPRLAESGSIKMTNVEARRGAFSQFEVELNSTSTNELCTSPSVDSLR